MTNPNSRRTFTFSLAAASLTIAAPRLHAADAKSAEKLAEADPYAKSMGFKHLTAQVDKVKYPRHDATQQCSKCQLYSGPADGWGTCSFFKRQVPEGGWCRNFKVVKAAA